MGCHRAAAAQQQQQQQGLGTLQRQAAKRGREFDRSAAANAAPGSAAFVDYSRRAFYKEFVKVGGWASPFAPTARCHAAYTSCQHVAGPAPSCAVINPIPFPSPPPRLPPTPRRWWRRRTSSLRCWTRATRWAAAAWTLSALCAASTPPRRSCCCSTRSVRAHVCMRVCEQGVASTAALPLQRAPWMTSRTRLKIISSHNRHMRISMLSFAPTLLLLLLLLLLPPLPLQTWCPARWWRPGSSTSARSCLRWRSSAARSGRRPRCCPHAASRGRARQRARRPHDEERLRGAARKC